MSNHFNGVPLPPEHSRPIGDSAASASAQEAMLTAARSVMTIEAITTGDRDNPLKLTGKLTIPAAEAFTRLRPAYEQVGYTPILRRADEHDVILAMPGVFEKPKPSRPTLAIVLFILTVISVFLTGMQQSDRLYIGVLDAILIRITGNTAQISPDLLPTNEVWADALRTGLQFTLSLLGILGAHEMGHYLVARYHKVHTTPPMFIPFPSLLGTMGAVIAMREPAPNRRIQFDIGVAGPLAGLIVALPVMLIGLNLSTVGGIDEFLTSLPEQLQDQQVILHEGQSLIYLGLKYAVFGRILPDGDVDVWIHPVAFAAWAGFLVTALNMIPVGQLDGGHVTFGLFGERARRFRIPVLIVLIGLAISGTIRDTLATSDLVSSPQIQTLIATLPGWSGWWLWAAIVYFLLKNHAPVLDEITDLDPPRKTLAVAMLIIFVLIFMPTPLTITPISALMSLFRF